VCGSFFRFLKEGVTSIRMSSPSFPRGEKDSLEKKTQSASPKEIDPERSSWDSGCKVPLLLSIGGTSLEEWRAGSREKYISLSFSGGRKGNVSSREVS